MSEYSFTIPGPLMGAVRTTQRQKFVDPRFAKYRQFKELVRCLAAAENLPDKLDLSWEVSIEIAVFWKKRQRCDIDNVLKGILDAVFVDDRRVLTATIQAQEHTGEEGAHVKIEINHPKQAKNRNLRHRGNKSKG